MSYAFEGEFEEDDEGEEGSGWGSGTPWGEDGLGNSWLSPTGLGCGIDTGMLSLVVTIVVFIVGVNLRRNRKVR